MRRLLLWLACTPLAFAQLDSNTLTIVATRTADLKPDQIQVSVDVTISQDFTLDAALAAVPGVGITIDDFVAVQSFSGSQNTWYFQLLVPFSKLTTTISALRAAQQKTPKQADISFQIGGPQFSNELLAAQRCQYGALLWDAQVQARKWASAAGVNLDEIVGLSDGSNVAPSGYFAGSVLTAISLTSYFSAGPVGGIPLASFSNFQWTPSPPSCTITVQFRITP